MANRNGMLAGAFFLLAIGISTTASADSLYARLGGTTVVAAFVADAIEKTHLPLAKDQLTERICTLTGGGCNDGGKLNLSHAAQPISSTEFSSLVEAMRESMRARNVPLAARNQLLEILAPVSRDAVTI
jgi:truncated hemoglobin YjbI